MRKNLKGKSSKMDVSLRRFISVGSLVANTNMRGNSKIINSLVYAKWTMRSCNVG